MGPNSDTGKGTLYINGEPLAEVGEIKIPVSYTHLDVDKRQGHHSAQQKGQKGQD